MLERLAAAVARHRWLVVVACLVVSVAAAVIGPSLYARLGYTVYRDPHAESSKAADLAKAQLGEGDPDVVALWRLPPGSPLTVDDAGVRQAIARALERVDHDPIVARALGPTGPAGSRFVSRDHKSAFAVLSVRGTQIARATALPRLRRLLHLELPDGQTLAPELGGLVPSGQALTRLAHTSLHRGESIALPVTGVLLFLVFGSLVAALLPLAVGGLGIVLALGVLSLLARVLFVDAFAINVVTILGLGVAIDYALFLVSRYRDELVRSGCTTDGERVQALGRAVATAGRAVLFSGITVAASLSGLLVFQQPFLRSVAIGGMAVVLLSATLALVVLPAVLAILGRRLESGRIRWLGRSGSRTETWRKLVRLTLKRPALVAVAVTTLLVVLGLPFRRLQPSRSDVRALPANQEPRRVSETLQRDFPQVSLTPLQILVEMPNDPIVYDRFGELWDYTERLRRLPGVERVESILSFAGVKDRDGAEELSLQLSRFGSRPEVQRHLHSIVHGRYVSVRVISSAQPDSPLGQEQVTLVRALAPPPGSRVLVYGQAAALHDFVTALKARTPLMLAIVGVTMFVVLFLAFRSVVLPIKAMLMTALSLTASFGAIVFVFQDGRWQHLLHYQAVGTIDASLPVLMFAVVFGLSMDYEVLILGRIRERWLECHDNDQAIVHGLSETGGLVTSAALLMVTVFAAFAAAPVVFVKALGMGMALAVALDAAVVRTLLVPATMSLLGKWNWWSPDLHLRRPSIPSPVH